MKRKYESPKMYAETFVPNQYCKGCGLMESFIPATEVRCQSDGHLNTARDTIFLSGQNGCAGVYDSSITNDNCCPDRKGNNTHGITTTGKGEVTGSWNKAGNWFTESSNGKQTAFKGYFEQDGHYHLFYVKEEQQEVMHLS